MKRSELALQLKARQFDSYDRLIGKGILNCSKEEWTDILYDLPNNTIIDSYNRCSCCNEVFLTKSQLNSLIRECDNSDDFLDFLDFSEKL